MLDHLLAVPGIDGGVTWQANELFVGTDDAPVSTPRTLIPGPGIMNFVQIDGTFDIGVTAAGRLTWTAQSTPVWGDHGFYIEKQGGGAFARTAGRAYIFTFNSAAAAIPFIFSWHTSTTLGNASDSNLSAAVIIEGTGSFRPFDGAAYLTSGSLLSTHSWTALQDERFALVLLSTGYLLLHLVAGEWILAWRGKVGSTASVYPAFKSHTGAGNMDAVGVRDLAAVANWWTSNVASPVSNTQYPSDADGEYILTVTAPTLAGTTAVGSEMRFRVQDANNYWSAQLLEDGSFKVISVSGGTPTDRVAAIASVISNGATLTMKVAVHGNRGRAYTLSGSTWTTRGSEWNVNFLPTATIMQPVLGTGWTGANLESMPRKDAKYQPLSAA